MNRITTYFSTIALLTLSTQLHSLEENFICIDAHTGEIIQELDSSLYQRVSPCSTFKIALSLIGFDLGILKDEFHPVWTFQEGYDDFIDSWKTPQTPFSWMQTSCIWYSRVLTHQLGLEVLQEYLSDFEYGNQDLSGGLDHAWVQSSLKISPIEQLQFLQKIIHKKLPISPEAHYHTKIILYRETLPNGWKLYGKTGWTGRATPPQKEIGWFIGWIEKDNQARAFAYTIQKNNIPLNQRIPRTIELLQADSCEKTP